jgi:hypothetical protein
MRRIPLIRVFFHGYIVFFVLLFPTLCLASSKPLWVQQYMSGTFNIHGVYHGIGSSTFNGASPLHDERELARKRAINDLGYNLSVMIKSKFANRIAQVGTFTDERIESSLFVSTRLALSGVTPQESWTNKGKRRYWVMVTIPKEQADKQVAQQSFLNEVIDRLEGKQDEVMQGIKAIEETLAQRLTVYEGQMASLAGLVETIDSKIEDASDASRKEYASLQKEITRLEQVFKASQDAKMEELIRQNRVLNDLLGKISQKIEKDYFLSLTVDDIRYQQANPQFWVRIEPERGQGADYSHGEKVRFLVRASRGCYLKVIYLSSAAKGARDTKKMNILLFPNKYDRDNFISSGQTMVIGRLGELEIKPPFGKDIVTVVASEKQFSDLEEILQQAKGRYYTKITSNTRGALDMRSRGIEVAMPLSSSEVDVGHRLSALNSVATDTCFIVSNPK